MDLKQELAVQANSDVAKEEKIQLTKNMSIQDMVKAMMPEIKKALPSVITIVSFYIIALIAI